MPKRYGMMRDRLRRFLLFAWRPIRFLGQHAITRVVVDWLLSVVGALVTVTVLGLAFAAYVIDLRNETLSRRVSRAQVWSSLPLTGSVMAAFTEVVEDLPDGRTVSRYSAPQPDPTGGPTYPLFQLNISDDGPPLPPIRWTLEGCGLRLVVTGLTSPTLEILAPSAEALADCVVRLRYDDVEYGPF